MNDLASTGYLMSVLHLEASRSSASENGLVRIPLCDRCGGDLGTAAKIPLFASNFIVLFY